MSAKLTTCLWFDGQAEEAAAFYTSLFPDSRIDGVNRAPGDAPDVSAGSVLTVDFTIAGAPFMALNGGPEFKFNEAVSFSIDCQDQAEVDHYWDALIADGGEPSMCGWLKDRFGVSWQVVPAVLTDAMKGSDRQGAARAFEAMLTMTKLDVEKIRQAYEGVPA